MTGRNAVGRLLLLTLILPWGCATAPRLFPTEPKVRVRILHAVHELTLTCKEPWLMKAGTREFQLDGSKGAVHLHRTGDRVTARIGEQTHRLPPHVLRLVPARPGTTLDIHDVPYGVGWWWEGREKRSYEGVILIHPGENAGFDVVIKASMETYLKGVVPYEIGPNSPPEALRAQAVAARSEAVLALTSKLYSGPHHDLTADVECQVFAGNRKRTPRSDRAVEATRGLILLENGRPIHAYYASNCGGHGELIANVWPDRRAPGTYLTAAPDGTDSRPDLRDEAAAIRWIDDPPACFCNPHHSPGLPRWSAKNFRWRREHTLAELTPRLAGGRDLGPLREIKPLRRGVSGRICELELLFAKGRQRKQGELVIRLLFKPPLRSSCFYVRRSDDRFVLKGAGWGHGVGMCQSGALARALAGQGFRTILGHYYSRACVARAY